MTTDPVERGADPDDSGLAPNPFIRAGRSLAALAARISWGTRVKMAVVLSFCLLIASPLINKLRHQGQAGSQAQNEPAQAPTLAIQGGAHSPPSPAALEDTSESIASPESSDRAEAGELIAASTPASTTKVAAPIGTAVAEDRHGAREFTDVANASQGTGESLVTEPELSPATAESLAEVPGLEAPPDPTLLDQDPPVSAQLVDHQTPPPTPPVNTADLELELPDSSTGPIAAPASLDLTTTTGASAVDEGTISVQPRDQSEEALTNVAGAPKGEPAAASSEPAHASAPSVIGTRSVAPSSIQLEPAPSTARPAPSGARDERSAPEGPARSKGDEVIGATIEPITHVVRRGENFWTIARHYYGSGRYYRALWRANAEAVPRIDELFIGSTILVPPPEHLDHEFIDPPAGSRGAVGSALSRREAAERRQK
jgi:nucleoid-associated protein YgaU